MHEMGVVLRIVQTANEYAEKNHAEKVNKLIVEIGEASSVLPRYVESFYKDVVPDFPLLQNCELTIETLPAKAFCLECGNVFHPGSDVKEVVHHSGDYGQRPALPDQPSACPECGSTVFKLVEGNTILIKSLEIL